MKKDVKKKTDSKPQYQAPVILDLGELARGAGATCSPGIGAIGGGPTCESGASVVYGACKAGAAK